MLNHGGVLSVEQAKRMGLLSTAAGVEQKSSGVARLQNKSDNPSEDISGKREASKPPVSPDLLAAVRSGSDRAPVQTSVKPVKELNIRLRPSANGSHLATVNGKDTYVLDRTRLTDALEAICGRDLDDDGD